MNVSSLVGKHVQVECWLPTDKGKVIRFYKGLLNKEDTDSIEIIDFKDGKKVIKKQFLNKVESMKHEDVAIFLAREENKMSSNLVIKDLDKKLRQFQEERAKEDIEFLDKRLNEFRKKSGRLK